MTASQKSLLAFALLLALAPGLAWGAASEWSTNPQSSVRLITPWQTAPREGEVILGLQFKLSPGWHVYWKNSGDAGFPPTATFQPAAVLGTPEILWPTPRRFDLPGDLVAFGYEGEVVYPVRAEIKAAAPAASAAGTTSDVTAPPAPQEILHITADLDYLVCQVDCVPFRYTLALDQPVGEKPVPDPTTVTVLQSWVEQLPRIVREVPGVRTGAVLDASRRGAVPDLEIRVLGVTAAVGKTDLFLESHDTFDAGRPRMKRVADGVVFHIPMKPKAANKALPAKTSIAWTVSNLTAKDGKPFSLEARRDVQVWTDAGDAPPDPMRDVPGRTGDRLPRLLLWAFLGGALMNLAPTVLALLAVELLALRSAGSGAREGAAAAMTGVIGGCWAVAGIALLARRAGLAADWSSLLQEPVVGALFVIAAAAFALNLWGLLEIPRAGTGHHLLAGLFTIPLALAWPVPLLRQPIAFAFGRGPAAVCAVFAVIGFGLALPYLLLTLAPIHGRQPDAAGTAPAAWLPRVREGLGFLAAGSALWLLYVLSRTLSPEGLAAIELALLGMSLFAWLRARRGSRRPARLIFVLGLVACAAGALWLADHNRLTPRTTAADSAVHSDSRPSLAPQ